MFLSHGANVNGRYLGGQTDSFLGTAASDPSPDMLNLLVAKAEGTQALRQAVQYGQLTNAKILFELGADVDEIYQPRDSINKQLQEPESSLHFAAKGGYSTVRRQCSKPEAVRFLLAHGAIADVENLEGKTPLQIAMQDQAEDIVQVFREHEIVKQILGLKATRMSFACILYSHILKGLY